VVGNDFLREISDSNQKFKVAVGTTHGAADETYQLIVTNPMEEVENILLELDTKGVKIDRRILMAQMSRAEALEFSSDFGAIGHLQQKETEIGLVVRPSEESLSNPVKGFDLILSEGEQANATQNEEVIYGASNDLGIDNDPLMPEDAREHRNQPIPEKVRAYLVTPHPAYNPDTNQLVTPLNVVTIDAVTSFDKAPAIRFHNESYVYLEDETSTILPGLTPPHESQSATIDGFKEKVVQMLAVTSKASVALIQDRDLFDKIIKSEEHFSEVCPPHPGVTPESQADCEVAAREEILLWKNDELVKITLSGSQLSTVLTNSQYLSNMQQRRLGGDARGEWVRSFGIETVQATEERALPYATFHVPPEKVCQSPSPSFPGTTSPPPGPKTPGPLTKPSTYCIDGNPIEPSRLYWVVTTRAIASNNELFAGIDPPAAGKAQSFTIAKPEFDRLLAQYNNPPGDGDQDADTRARDVHENWKQQQAGQQERAQWHLNIPTWTASYTEYNPNNTDTALSSFYGAATDTRASAPHSSDFEASQNVRFLREGKLFDLGPAFMMNVSKKVTGGSSGDSINYGSNSIQPEWISEINLGRPFFQQPRESTKLVPELRLANSLLFQTQMFGPVLPIPCDNPAGGCKPQFVVDRERAFVPRIGVREDFSNDSYTEFGYEYGLNTHVLQEVDIVNGGLVTEACNLTLQTLSQCIAGYQHPAGPGSSPPSPVVIASTKFDGIYRTRQNQGFYVDWQTVTTMPSWSQQKSKLYLKVQGDLWGVRNVLSQSAVETRYDLVTAAGFQLPIRGNLTLLPAYQVFFYENMNVYKPLVSKTINVSLSWTFDWHRPVPFWTAATFATPQTAGGSKSPLPPSTTPIAGSSPLPK
jgi:hypothetical protein